MKAKLTLSPMGLGHLGGGRVLMGCQLHVDQDDGVPFTTAVMVRFDEPPSASVCVDAEVFTAAPHMMGWMAGKKFEVRFQDHEMARGEFPR